MKRKTDNFNKFYNKKRNSAIKEEFRQEKKAAKKERKEGIERHFEEKRKTKFQPTDTLAANQAPGTPKAPGAIKSPGGPKAPGGPKGPVHKGTPLAAEGEHLPLNKYIAHGGICSRRDAADLIRHGKVTVNGKPVTEPGTKVMPTDLVKVNGKKVTISRNFVYILLNKPKDYITTTDDPQGRRTVLDLIRAATTERVYPVGRLDRNTSGVLLLTNDGDLSQKLAHPSHEIKKVYHVTLDKALTKADFDTIISGVTLEDGFAHVDVMAYADPRDKAQIGLEIHSGRNRIVRRIFEHLGYDVRGLDRVMYAGLTKKNVQRGKWRFLNEREIRILKYLNSSIKGSAARAKDWAATPEAPAASSPKPAQLKPKTAPTKPKPALAKPKPPQPRPKTAPRSTPRSKKTKI
jgi:23S rRNA pseudouridine2605 synthase